MIKASVIITVGILSTSILAGADTLTDIKASNPNATPYQILQTLYNQSSSPADLSDFDSINNLSSNQHCAIATQTDKTAKPFYFAKAQVIVKLGTSAKPGKPSTGPLFPDTPATPAVPKQVGEAVVFFRAESDRQNAADYIVAQVSSNTSDLVINSYSLAASYVSNSIYARKNGSFIAIHALQNNEGTDEVYAYCYRR